MGTASVRPMRNVPTTDRPSTTGVFVTRVIWATVRLLAFPVQWPITLRQHNVECPAIVSQLVMCMTVGANAGLDLLAMGTHTVTSTAVSALPGQTACPSQVSASVLPDTLGMAFVCAVRPSVRVRPIFLFQIEKHVKALKI